MSKTLEQLKKEVDAVKGQTIGTIYGPSLVEGYEEQPDGRVLVILKEFGEELYSVDIMQWDSLKQ